METNCRLYAPAQRKSPAHYWVGIWVDPRACQNGFCRSTENVLSLLERIEGSCIYSCTNMYFTYFVASGRAEKGFLGQAVCVTARWILRLSRSFSLQRTCVVHTRYTLLEWNVTCRLLQTCCLYYCCRNILSTVDLFFMFDFPCIIS
jgi:hypothetical protein